MTVPKAERLAKIHAEALDQFDRIQKAVRDERLQCLQDRRFYSISGAQWEGAIGEQFENKPKFEVNKVHLSVFRIINEYRNNRITVDFVSKPGATDDKMADICDGLHRADEQDSVADEAHDNAFEEGTAGGFGAWRLRAVYEDEEDPENEQQRIRIEPIFDADTCVFFDLDAKRQDKADAKHCFVLSSQTVQGYKDEWGDDPTSWPKEISQREFDWVTPDIVYIAEYYRVEETKDESVVFTDPQGNEERHLQSVLDEEEGLLDRLLATGRKEIRRKRIKVKTVRKYIMSGSKILDDCGRIPGKRIPIVPFFGKRWFVDGVERCMGHVRLSKDAQRLKNVQLSKLGEISAYSSVSKPLLTPEQIAGHQVMWSEDNVKNYPYLLINPVTDASGQTLPAPPVGYTKAPDIPAALAALLQLTEADMQELLGSQQAAEQIVSNVSGKTVELVQQRLDMQTFIYMSNFARAMRCEGEIWFGMAQELYVEPGRKMKTVGTHGETGATELMRPVRNTETSAVEYENDLSNAEMEVTVEVGPSTRSRKDATVRSLMGMMSVTQDPETLQVLGSMVMLNMEGEGIGDVRDYFRQRLVKMGVLKPTDEEAKALEEAKAAQGEDPQATYLKAAADQAQADATAARVKTVDTLAAAELKRAQAAQTLASIDQKDRQQAIDMAGAVIQPHDAAPFDPVQAARQDVVHADISVPEARHLVADGGAGKVNPATGRVSFYRERGDETAQGRGDYDAGGADGRGSSSGGVGGNGDGSGGRSRQRDYDSTQAAIDAGRSAGYHDTNADRAGRFTQAGSVDPNAVEAGTAYGIDAGPGSFGYDWKKAALGFAKGGPIGLLGGVTYSPGSAAVNGGGWTGLGSSGQSPSNTPGGQLATRDGGADVRVLAQGSQAPAQTQAMAAQAPAQVAAYQPRVPIELWSTLDPKARAEAMTRFWQSF